MGAILVTGAFGLVGHNVHKQLVAADRAVIALDVTSAFVPGYPTTACDVRDIHRLYAIAGAGPIDAIIHCGAFSGPMLERNNPHLLVDVNVSGTANLLELARLRKIPRVVFCSSVSAYGHTPEGMDLVTEEAPLRPTTVYGATKVAGEALARGYVAQHGVSAVCLRIGWVYGPRRATHCDLRDLLAAGLAGEAFARPHGRSALRQYVHAEDVARALILAAGATAPKQLAYTITDGQPVTLAGLADLVRARFPALDASIGPGIDPEEDRQAPFDIAAAARDLGYEPRIRLADGLSAYADWLAAQAGPGRA